MESIHTDNCVQQKPEETSCIVTFLKNIYPYERLVIKAIHNDADLHRLAKIPEVGRFLLAEVLALLDKKDLCLAVASTYLDREQLHELLVCSRNQPELSAAVKRQLSLTQAVGPHF